MGGFVPIRLYDRTTTARGHERIRQLSEALAGRSRMHVARGRLPRDANAHMRSVALRART